MFSINKYSIIVTIFAAYSIATVASQTPPALELYGSVGYGRVLDGFQLDLAEDTIAPTPDTVNPFELRVGAAVYPIVSWLGVEAHYTVLGRVGANADEVSDTLRLYDYTAIAGGMALRGSWPIKGGFGLVTLSGGIRRSSQAVADDFEELLGITASDIEEELGWYVSGRFGGTAGIFYGAMQIDYIADTGTIASSQEEFDGNYLMFHLLAGVGLFGSDE